VPGVVTDENTSATVLLVHLWELDRIQCSCCAEDTHVVNFKLGAVGFTQLASFLELSI